MRPLERRMVLGGAARCGVNVPASTSNLGAGFDCIGVAVNRWLNVVAAIDDEPGADGFTIERAGTLADLDVSPEDDLIARGFVAACEWARVERPPVLISANSGIPVGRGLGSSAAACVAGALAANALLELGLASSEICDIAAGIEGHPDNVAPSVYGGAVIAVQTASAPIRTWHVAPLRVDPSLRLVFAIPDFEVATHTARAVLPADVPFATAVDAVGRAGALVAGLASAEPELLRAALDDVLHVPHRRALVRGYDAVAAAAVDAGAFGATLSGSGSSIVAVSPESSAEVVGAAMCAAWQQFEVGAASLVSAGGVCGGIVRCDASGRTRTPA